MQVCNDFKCMWRGAAPNIDEQMLEFENIKIHGHSAAEQNSCTHIWWLWVKLIQWVSLYSRVYDEQE